MSHVRARLSAAELCLVVLNINLDVARRCVEGKGKGGEGEPQKAAVHLLTSPSILVFSRNTGLKRRCAKRKALSSRR